MPGCLVEHGLGSVGIELLPVSPSRAAVGLHHTARGDGGAAPAARAQLHPPRPDAFPCLQVVRRSDGKANVLRMEEAGETTGKRVEGRGRAGGAGGEGGEGGSEGKGGVE